MEDGIKRVLFVNSEMTPYLGEGEIATATRMVAQGIQDKKFEVRSFMPRYGLINEIKNQLHEVIRLSGINLVIGDVDRPLIIKVASLPTSRMQVYFIDNEDYFRRKALFNDANGNFFDDNGERAVFFARGVLETVKKLRWSPDVIHCNGWISHILPLYLKKSYKEDPIFANTKVVTSLYDDIPNVEFGRNFVEHILYQGVNRSDLSVLDRPNGSNLAKLAILNSDGVVLTSDKVNKELIWFSTDNDIPVLNCKNKTTEELVEEYTTFYDKL